MEECGGWDVMVCDVMLLQIKILLSNTPAPLKYVYQYQNRITLCFFIALRIIYSLTLFFL